MGNKAYWMIGELESHELNAYILKPKLIREIKAFFSLVELRYLCKEKVKQFIHAKLIHGKSAHLISAILTGEVEDRLLRFEFSKTGVQHVLAVSGFHFGMIILFLQGILCWAPNSLKLVLLCAFVSLYFLFVGSSPSVMRSYISAILWLLGKLFHRKASGLNLMGVALSIETILYPDIAKDVGFQFSFLSCLGILLYYSTCEKFLKNKLKQLKNEEAQTLPFLSKCAFVFGKFLRTSFSLDLAVNITLQPLLFFYFHQFSLLSSFFNLFFPFLLSISTFSFLIGSLVAWIAPLLANPIFIFCDYFTTFSLHLTSYPLPILNQNLNLGNFDPNFIIAYLFVLLQITISKPIFQQQDMLFPKNTQNEKPRRIFESNSNA